MVYKILHNSAEAWKFHRSMEIPLQGAAFMARLKILRPRENCDPC